ncbi:MAG: tRNA lysidine(34) synthetase TilS [Chlorobiaceae bacterium]
MNALEKKFLAEIRRLGLCEEGERVLVALSGGPDSMALVALFIAAQPVLHCTIAIAHCNFQLRGEESDADEAFVVNHARALGLECHVERFDTRRHAGEMKRSIEETARLLRYRYFERLQLECGYTKIATGHHVSDNAETMLFNLFRGVSLPGLKGIRAQNGTVIRPMLPISKGDISRYLKERAIAFRTDASNLQSDHDRNFIRNRVIPLIEERFAGKLMASLRRLSEQAGELEEFLELYFLKLAEKEPGLSLRDGELDVDALRRLTVFEQKEIFKRALMEMGAPVDARGLQKLVDLLGTQPGRVVMAGRQVRVLWKGRKLCFLSGEA